MRIPDTERRLRNWQRWALNDDPHIWFPSVAGGFGEMIHDDGDKEGWADSSKEKREPPVDTKDARHVVDVAIMATGPRHVLTIKRWYINFRRKEVTDEELQAAIRALADRLYPIPVLDMVAVCV